MVCPSIAQETLSLPLQVSNEYKTRDVHLLTFVDWSKRQERPQCATHVVQPHGFRWSPRLLGHWSAKHLWFHYCLSEVWHHGHVVEYRSKRSNMMWVSVRNAHKRSTDNKPIKGARAHWYICAQVATPASE